MDQLTAYSPLTWGEKIFGLDQLMAYSPLIGGEKICGLDQFTASSPLRPVNCSALAICSPSGGAIPFCQVVGKCLLQFALVFGFGELNCFDPTMLDVMLNTQS